MAIHAFLISSPDAPASRLQMVVNPKTAGASGVFLPSTPESTRAEHEEIVTKNETIGLS
jgi:hypothetical protein